MKKILLVPVLFAFVLTTEGTDIRSEIYNAYISNRMDLWKNAIDRLDALKGKSDEQVLELLNFQYGYIGYCLGFDKKEEARKYFSKALLNIDILDAKSYKPSVISAYKSAFFGYRISFNKLSAPVNGIKSVDMAKLAIEQDKTNYLGYVQYGNAQFYMPSAFGGSKKEALKYFLIARSILEKDPDSLKSDWNYMSLLILIGQAYSYLDDMEASKSIYEYILKIEPGFKYVRDDLYPKLVERMKDK